MFQKYSMQFIAGLLLAVQVVRSVPTVNTPLLANAHPRLVMDGIHYIPELSVKKPSMIRTAAAVGAVSLLVGGAVLTASSVQRQQQLESDKKKGNRVLYALQAKIIADNAAAGLKGPVAPPPNQRVRTGSSQPVSGPGQPIIP